MKNQQKRIGIYFESAFYQCWMVTVGGLMIIFGGTLSIVMGAIILMAICFRIIDIKIESWDDTN